MNGRQFARHAGHHHIPTLGFADQQGDQVCAEEWHVRGGEESFRMGGDAQAGVDAAKGAAIRDQIGDHPDAKIGVEVEVVGDDQDLREQPREAIRRDLDQPLAPELDEGLIEPHPRGLPARQHDAGHTLQASSSAATGASNASSPVISGSSCTSLGSVSSSCGASSRSVSPISSSSSSIITPSVNVSSADRLRNQVGFTSGVTSSSAREPSASKISFPAPTSSRAM